VREDAFWPRSERPAVQREAPSRFLGAPLTVRARRGQCFLHGLEEDRAAGRGVLQRESFLAFSGELGLAGKRAFSAAFWAFDLG
jgi:hypothetical protein